MTTCDEAQRELQRAEERLMQERVVLQGYRDQLSRLESEHDTLTRQWKDASALAVENERSWEQAREALRSAIDTERAAQEKYAYWDDQRSRLDSGGTTEYSGEQNERALVDAKRDEASDARYNASQARQTAESDVTEAKDRYERSMQFLQSEADEKFANEDARSTLGNQIEVQDRAVSETYAWVGQAKAKVDEVC